MLSKTMLKALNAQINSEMSSSYLYLGMAAYFKHINLDGFSNWMAGHSKEEWGHAMRIWNYVYEQRNRVTLADIQTPTESWKSPTDAFGDALKAEERTTGQIHALVTLAQKENDHATFAFLQWFVTEQVEEEQLFDSVLQKVKLIGDHYGALMMLDHELGASNHGS